MNADRRLPCAMAPFHLLQQAGRHSPNALVLYAEASPE
jgi:hypothetical protein